MAGGDQHLFFEPRFCGPPGTVNGGFACGTVAQLCGGAAEVTLRRPLPVATPLAVRSDGDRVLVVDDRGDLLAEARPAGTDAGVHPSTDPPEAPAGRAAYFADPAFPGCFVCGTDRAPGDGLRIFPGPVSDRALWVVPWTPDSSVAGPDGRVRPEVAWAALDCPTGIAAGEAAELPDDMTLLLGRMTAHVLTAPRAGQDCRVLAWPLVREGRKLFAGSALVDADGAVLATALTLWLTVPHPVRRQTAGATS